MIEWQAVQESQTKISNLYTKENYEVQKQNSPTEEWFLHCPPLFQNEAAQMNIRLNVAEQSLGFGGASKEDLSVSSRAFLNDSTPISNQANSFFVYQLWNKGSVSRRSKKAASKL